ncbi:hypothetical protein METBIDRAFT_76861 [Metschnikowia bicuspidata var. bicuspidata NRRL YB-4993]|uniref:Uncharacterized protein n=1 Tax=Metschnikowia bicuspidata var. bicuspidata NRRL YB-4993 TaxID=869754 RepID=A0A1A0HIF4_9ASCO|nr:hypothetical protein METBIDRAFT_76861 [Metschnikowia bicuspidata var. bicuspidata NRRL YB-4993]OBA23949.1 hypothetical protein METBIDRAFT_76861 [Metschnikowia bicuspidata var. bicuspidata NRRL YB-4993]
MEFILKASLYSSAFSVFFFDFPPPGTIKTQEVGLLVAPADPKSSFDGMNTKGTEESSHNTGICEITSAGEMSPAITTSPFSPFLNALTTSLTPLLTCLALEAFLTVLRTFLFNFFGARGFAKGNTAAIRLS